MKDEQSWGNPDKGELNPAEMPLNNSQFAEAAQDSALRTVHQELAVLDLLREAVPRARQAHGGEIGASRLAKIRLAGTFAGYEGLELRMRLQSTRDQRRVGPGGFEHAELTHQLDIVFDVQPDSLQEPERPHAKRGFELEQRHRVPAHLHLGLLGVGDDGGLGVHPSLSDLEVFDGTLDLTPGDLHLIPGPQGGHVLERHQRLHGELRRDSARVRRAAIGLGARHTEECIGVQRVCCREPIKRGVLGALVDPSGGDRTGARYAGRPITQLPEG